MDKLKLNLTPLAIPLKYQLENQNLICENINLYQEACDSITVLIAVGVLNESEVKDIRQRLYNQISNDIKIKQSF